MKKALSVFAGIALSAASSVAMASWTGSVSPTPGNSNITTSGDNASAHLGYTFNQGVFNSNWTFTSDEALQGDSNFAWTYSGFHNIFLGVSSLTLFVDHVLGGSTGYLLENDGNSFSFSGLVSVAAANGDHLRLVAHGSSFDAISYNAGGDITLTAVPEPMSLALIGAGLLAFGLRRRK